VEKAAILKPWPALRGHAGHLLAQALLLISLCLLVSAPAWSATSLTALVDLSVADKYRQLNLILMVSEGIDETFVHQLLPRESAETTLTKEDIPHLEIDDFQTPLNRIVDQRAMITQAAHVFRFALENRANIQLEITELAASDPAQVSQVNLIQLAEDAIIIRSALAGSIEYLAGQGDPAMAANLETYQLRTIYLRNVMEYWKFDKELDAITDDAMKDTGGRMAAYQRMLEDEPNLMGFKQHLQAVEQIYKNTQALKVNPKDLESKELIEQESEVH
jgi:hypothetical protein